MGPVAHNQWDRIDTIMYMLIYPHRPLVKTRTIDHIGREPHPSPNPNINHNPNDDHIPSPNPNPNPNPNRNPNPSPNTPPRRCTCATWQS